MKIGIAKSTLFVVVLAIAMITALLLFQTYSKRLFAKRDTQVRLLHSIHTSLDRFEYDLLKNTLLLYGDYDTIMQQMNAIEKKNSELESLLSECPVQVQHLLQQYKKSFTHVHRLLLRYTTYNSIVKNSLIYIPRLIKKLLIISNDSAYNRLLAETLATTFLIKSSLDPIFIQALKKDFTLLQKIEFDNSKLQRNHRLLLTHLQLFIQNFPKLKTTIDQILSPTLHNQLKFLSVSLRKEFHKRLLSVDLFFFAVIVLYLIALIAIIAILRQLHKENAHLKRLQRYLLEQARTDGLTKLLNRRAFKEDRRYYKHPLFILINIEGFKHYNELYGMAAGDHILRQCAQILREFSKKYIPAARLYRIGSDEFGILLEKENVKEEEQLLKTLISTFKEHTIIYKNISLTLSILATLSHKRPLLETADLAMHQLKKKRHLHYLIYSDDMGLIQEIKINIKRSKRLRDAIQTNRIIPYFQPIFDISHQKIVKYEVLTRIVTDSGIESIHPYLTVAKEISLYEDLSRTILQQAFEVLYKRQIPLSVNIAMQDIENDSFLGWLEEEISRKKELARLLSFELLESEALKDYTHARSFIEKFKRFGISIGIDDFGSGYSNFSHIFNLDIDFIKIDGSLIKDIDHNPLSLAITRSITTLAHDFDIKVVAEFVHSESVYTTVQQLHIDYAQGYLLGKPSPLDTKS